MLFHDGQYTHDQPTFILKFICGTIVGEAGQTWVTIAGDGNKEITHEPTSNNKNVEKDEIDLLCNSISRTSIIIIQHGV